MNKILWEVGWFETEGINNRIKQDPSWHKDLVSEKSGTDSGIVVGFPTTQCVPDCTSQSNEFQIKPADVRIR